MGGSGSGRWYRLGSKTTVEDSHWFGISEFRDRLYSHYAATITWSRAGTVTGSIGYFVTWDDDRPTVTLQYRWRNEEDIRIPIALQATYPALGGKRWWFTCPLIVNGVACNRRVGKLYLPAGARYFGCRRCHNLTYESSQDAHKTERLFAWAGSYLGLDLDKDTAALFGSRFGGKRLK
jgi:hypothetical protein